MRVAGLGFPTRGKVHVTLTWWFGFGFETLALVEGRWETNPYAKPPLPTVNWREADSPPFFKPTKAAFDSLQRLGT